MALNRKPHLCLVSDTVSFSDELHAVSAVSSVSSVDGLIDEVRSVLSEELVRQVGACFHFHITTDSGQTSSYYVDLTQGKTELDYKRTAEYKAKRKFTSAISAFNCLIWVF